MGFFRYFCLSIAANSAPCFNLSERLSRGKIMKTAMTILALAATAILFSAQCLATSESRLMDKAESLCGSFIESSVKNPATIDYTAGYVHRTSIPAKNAAFVIRGFTAENGYGAKKSFTAMCIHYDGSRPDYTQLFKRPYPDVMKQLSN